MHLRSLLLTFILAGIAASCSTSHEEVIPLDDRSLLEQSSQMEIFALHPNRHSDEGKPKGADDDFHGYRILDRARLDDAKERKRLVSLVYQGIDKSNGMVAACFDPRHGIRARNGDQVVDLVICYECLQIHLHRSTDGDGADESALTSETVEPAVTRIFEAHGLEIHRGH